MRRGRGVLQRQTASEGNASLAGKAARKGKLPSGGQAAAGGKKALRRLQGISPLQ